jgi:two-component system phosphate regulon sensor histidine kinase PhoR
LIQDLQNIIRLENSSSIDIQLINLNTFFENISMIVQPLLEEKGLQITLDIDPQLTHFSADPFKFEQIFINLVENSLRYADSGEITIRTLASPNTLTIEVCDQGSGIAAEHLPRIFERFYVADPSRNRSNGGTGLGLAIVKHIVLLHLGTIEVDSELGKGTCFRMHFPCNVKHNPELA